MKSDEDAIYYRKNAERVKARTNSYYHNNKDAVKAAKKRQSKELKLFWAAASRARSLGLPFDITVDDITIPSVCPVLGFPIVVTHNALQYDSPSVDRIIPGDGYVKGNIVVVSWRANKLKNDATMAELKAVVDFYEGLKCPHPSSSSTALVMNADHQTGLVGTMTTTAPVSFVTHITRAQPQQ
jgi:hypothetical protein